MRRRLHPRCSPSLASDSIARSSTNCWTLHSSAFQDPARASVLLEQFAYKLVISEVLQQSGGDDVAQALGTEVGSSFSGTLHSNSAVFEFGPLAQGWHAG